MVRAAPDAVVRAGRVIGGAPAVGAKVTVAVRPEQVAAEVRPFSGDNVLQGTLRHRTFLGPVTRLAIGLPGGSMLNADLRGVSTLGPGEKVYAGFQPYDAVVLRT